MARPKKDNADYFTHDRDMRNDNKLKAVRRKFKNEGYAIWNMLLEHLTDCDFFEYEYNTLNIELLSGDFDIEPVLLKEMIDYFILLNLLTLEDGTIHSKKLTERFESLLKKRKRDVKPKKQALSTPETSIKKVIADENPQRRVEESKGEYSTLDEEGEKKISDFNNKILDIEELSSEYLKNERVITAVVGNKKNKFKNLKHLETRLSEFCSLQIEKGVLSKTLADFSSHFRYWHIKGKKDIDNVDRITSQIPIG